MASIRDRLQVLLEDSLRLLPIVESNARDPVQDRQGSAISMVSYDYRFVGIAKYILHNDVTAFRHGLADSARIQDALFKRFESGEPIDDSYVSMLSYKWLFDALAAGDLPLARSLAGHMGGRDKIEKEHDHPFDYHLGYTLKWFVLGDREQMARWAEKFEAICEQKDNADFRGYARMFHAILSADADAAQSALAALAAGHQRQSKGRGVFSDSDDELLCVWGIGMANLARSRGLAVHGVPPLIPHELLV